MQNKFLKSCRNKLKMLRRKGLIIPCTSCKSCRERVYWAIKREPEVIPRDVPRGHLVVYVGEEYKRFVIKISLLKHPFFKTLLDQARDAYDFSANSRLWIPCDEYTFLDVVRCMSM